MSYTKNRAFTTTRKPRNAVARKAYWTKKKPTLRACEIPSVCVTLSASEYASRKLD